MACHIIPFPQELRPHLPTIVGNVDYLTLRQRLEQIDVLLRDSGVERDFVQRALAGWTQASSGEPTALQQAQQLQVRGLIAGSMDGELRAQAEALSFPVILTEGFGRAPMARPVFELLRAQSGREASISAVTRVRSSAMRPQVLVPLPTESRPSPPTTNSYKRLVPGFEAPGNLAYSARNRSASIRIPMYSPSPKAKRIEFRSPDPACNGYISFAAMLMAGLDGIENKLNPGQPLDKDIYGMTPEELKDIPKMPGSLEEALENMRKDHAFLLKGDVFTRDFLDLWIAAKRKEHDALRLRPPPYEFFLYYDV